MSDVEAYSRLPTKPKNKKVRKLQKALHRIALPVARRTATTTDLREDIDEFSWKEVDIGITLNRQQAQIADEVEAVLQLQHGGLADQQFFDYEQGAWDPVIRYRNSAFRIQNDVFTYELGDETLEIEPHASKEIIAQLSAKQRRIAGQLIAHRLSADDELLDVYQRYLIKENTAPRELTADERFELLSQATTVLTMIKGVQQQFANGFGMNHITHIDEFNFSDLVESDIPTTDSPDATGAHDSWSPDIVRED